MLCAACLVPRDAVRHIKMACLCPIGCHAQELTPHTPRLPVFVARFLVPDHQEVVRHVSQLAPRHFHPFDAVRVGGDKGRRAERWWCGGKRRGAACCRQQGQGIHQVRSLRVALRGSTVWRPARNSPSRAPSRPSPAARARAGLLRTYYYLGSTCIHSSSTRTPYVHAKTPRAPVNSDKTVSEVVNLYIKFNLT